MERTTLSANYCPHCGTAVAAAVAVATEEPLTSGHSIDEVFESRDAHLVVHGNDIRLFVHADDQ